MSGRELAERLTAERPEMKVLFMSGYSEELVADRGMVGRGAAFLAKPFSPEQLLAKLRAVLAGDGPRL
jgi:DNA-binding response OmpR family regulator